MKNNWTIKAIVSAVITWVITYWLTNSTTAATISAMLIFIGLLFINPKTRYIRAFFIVITPLLSNFVFSIEIENFQAGIKQLDWVTTIALTLIAIVCLLLDYFERNGKWKGIFICNKNKANASGENITINQNINNNNQ